jgi:hypothetical protein
MPDMYLVPGLLTPFAEVGTVLASLSAFTLAGPIAKAVGERELVFEAGLDPELVALSDFMACSTSFIGAAKPPRR